MVLPLVQDNLQWSVGDLLYYLFRHQGKKEMVLKFLNGQMKYKVSHILEYWKGSSDGLLSLSDPERTSMYALSPSFTKISAARPAITLFAAQIVHEELIRTAKHMASKRGGLHTYTTSKVKVLTPDDNVSTFSDCQTLFKKGMPLAWQYFIEIATPDGQEDRKLAASDLKVIQEVAQDPTSFWGPSFLFRALAKKQSTSRASVAENKQKDLDMEKLLSFIDTDHLNRMFTLQWMRILINFIPCLRVYKSEDAKRRLPSYKAQIFPLSSNSYNETITSGMLSALLDFVKTLGFTEDSPLYRLLLAGSDDPSSIGHSAAEVKWKAPANIKKVDFYPYSQLAYQIVNARAFDCLRIHFCGKDGDILKHFESLEAQDKVPSFAALWKAAEVVFKTFGHTHVFEREISGDFLIDLPIIQGDPWVPPVFDQSSANTDQPTKKPHGKKRKNDTDCLAQLSWFIFDAIISWEMIYATSEGDIGRVWEVMKFMLLMFTGSSHTKYTNYLLEMFCDLELESSMALRNAILDSWLVCISGHSFIAGDQFQEQIQDEFYEHIGKKDPPHSWRFVQVKKAVNEGLGLATRGRKNLEPHNNPEILLLLRIYQDEQLHWFRAGRTYGGEMRKVDDFARGLERLMGSGKSKDWVRETTWARHGNVDAERAAFAAIEAALDRIDDKIEEEQREAERNPQTQGWFSHDEDGELRVAFEGELGNQDPDEIEINDCHIQSEKRRATEIDLIHVFMLNRLDTLIDL
ncbi:hypothetical protein C8J56DRAFT_907353 [Mycena floridula]|nr:hypothetical protein C8J56DRAFT_907353 [Mycena floridula]